MIDPHLADEIPEPDRDFDVAISFLNEDHGLATELRDKLGEQLDVFVYSRKQDEVAGTDGIESFRAVFRSRSKLVVVLYRARWGGTFWTRIEKEAIEDRYLNEGPKFLFLIMLDDSPPPVWVTDRLIRFSLKDFGVDGAVGAIKARARDQGSELRRPSIAYRAQKSQELAKFEQRRAEIMRLPEGVHAAAVEAKRLVALVRRHVEELQTAAPALGVEFGADSSQVHEGGIVKTKQVAVAVSYLNRISNVLSEATLTIRELQGNVLLPGESGYYLREPKEVSKVRYTPELTQNLGWCWKDPAGKVHSSEKLAEEAVHRFLALVDRMSQGKLPPIPWD